MQKTTRRISTFILALLICVTILPNVASAADAGTVKSALNDTAKYIHEIVKNPQVGSIGGEWAILGLARSGYSVPDSYYQKYYATVEAYVKACGGVLHAKKYTEYSRLALALSAIGKDPRDVVGYNLLTPLGDFDKTIWQGINGPTFALIALDSGSYPMPINPDAATQATRDMYVDEILRRQLNDGGFSLAAGTTEDTKNEAADVDVTAMALQALSKYQYRSDVKKVIDEALDCLSKKQHGDGGFASYGVANTESTVQVIVALCELGIPLDDSRFVKNGNTAIDGLLLLYKSGAGFLHTANGTGSNQMAAEQGFYGLVAAVRAMDGQNTLYRMNDAIEIPDSVIEGPKPGEGLPTKNPDVQNKPVIFPGRTFSDVQGHENQPAIEALAARNIINGKSEDWFDPDATMTRAEFCTIVVRCLGLTPVINPVFEDVNVGSWYESYVGAAYNYGIVNGTTPTTFNPEGTITRQEASLMVMRAAKLTGMEPDMEPIEIRDMLSQFVDYMTSAEWARHGLAFCYSQNLFDQSDIEMYPLDNALRAEMAEVLFRMLGAANLL